MTITPLAFVVEEEPKLARTLKMLVPKCFSVAQFDSGEDFLNGASSNQCGCVVAALRLPGMSGLELLEAMPTRRLQLPLILIANQSAVAETIRAYDAGAFRVFEKPANLAEISKAVEYAIMLDQHCRQTVAERTEILNKLTEREQQVLERLFQDKPTKQIALELGISPCTVGRHRAAIIAKCSVNSIIGLLHLYHPPQQSPSPAAHIKFERLRHKKHSVPPDSMACCLSNPMY